jgi:Ca2+-binding RTX toxin-like protein
MRSRLESNPIHAKPATTDGTDDADYFYDEDGRSDFYRTFGGDDTIWSGEGNDTVLAGDGDDFVYADGYGANSFSGGAGNDSMYAGSGVDTLLGGAGDDYLRSGFDAGYVDGGDGIDRGSFYISGDHGVRFDAAKTGNHRTVVADVGGGLVTFKNVETVAVTGGIYNDTLIGGKAGDYLQGGSGADQLIGGAGADLLSDTGGGARMSGGEGDDSFVLELSTYTNWPAGAYRLEGGEGHDTAYIQGRASTSALRASLTDGVLEARSSDGAFVLDATSIEDMSIFGGEAADTLRGGAGDDVLNGVYGDNKIYGGDGDDFLMGWGDQFGGAGDDTISSGWGHSDTVDGGEGFDLFAIYSLTEPYAIDQQLDYSEVRMDQASTTVDDSGHIDVLKGFEGLYVRASWGNDLVIGSNGADRLDGSFGSDTLRGADGDDTLIASTFGWAEGQVREGADVFDGGTGIDLIQFEQTPQALIIDLKAGTASGSSTGADTLIDIEGARGSYGDDTIIGNTGANALDGWKGADALDGADGNDTLIGGLGADTIRGGQGRDIFIYASVDDSTGDASDLIAGLEGKDSIDLSLIDARANKAGDQAFRFVSAFDGRSGEATVSYADGLTSLGLDTDGDGVADAIIRLAGDQTGFDGYVL